MNKINYPVITFDKYSFSIIQSEEELTRTTSAGLKNGLFENLIIVDNLGQCFKVINAKKSHGIGPLWGYNIFLNQKIRINLEFGSCKTEETLNSVKERILKIFKKDRYFWEAGGNLDELIQLVKESPTISELIVKLKDIINKEYKN
jgi:hypothetical protein